MNELIDDIYKVISERRSVLLVGKTDSGKTWYIKNTLIPFLQDKKNKVGYFGNPDLIQVLDTEMDIFIIDEVETLLDRNFLELRSKSSESYYSVDYLKKVSLWIKKLKGINNPCIYILTRNSREEIDNIINTVKVMDWGTEVQCFAFLR